MKKNQLLLLTLLFTANTLLTTKDPGNIHPASIKNIKNPDNKGTVETQSGNSYKSSKYLKRIEKSVSKTSTETVLLNSVITLFEGATTGIKSYVGTFIASTLVQQSLGVPIVINPLNLIKFCAGTSYILHKTINTQKTLRKIIANEEINTGERLVPIFDDIGFMLGIARLYRFLDH